MKKIGITLASICLATSFYAAADLQLIWLELRGSFIGPLLLPCDKLYYTKVSLEDRPQSYRNLSNMLNILTALPTRYIGCCGYISKRAV